jgi:glycosyltransferase involved in cell wall biosynthesis
MSSPLSPEAADFQPAASTAILPFPTSPQFANIADIPERATYRADYPNADAAAGSNAIQVLHLVNGEHYSGAERVQDLLARQLPRFGCEVSFACVKPRRFPDARQSKNAPLFKMPMRGRFDLRVVKHIVDLVCSEGYELIHAHTPRTALVGRMAALRAGVPLVYHVHSPAGRDSTRRLLNSVNALVEWATVRDADRLIAVSPSVREYMIGRGVPDERVVCVPNGVPLAGHNIERAAPTHAWTLGSIALFRPRKGVEILLEALAALRSRGANLRLRAVGSFETAGYETTIRALAVRLGLEGAIDWIGFTRNVNRELAKIDVFVLPSLFGEGLPMVVLEAMAAGLPVVASRVEGVPEAVAHRQTGLLFEPGSVSQLAAAIDEIIKGEVDYAALSCGARRRHAERFSDEKMAAGVANVYRDVLANCFTPSPSGRGPG